MRLGPGPLSTQHTYTITHHIQPREAQKNGKGSGKMKEAGGLTSHSNKNVYL